MGGCINIDALILDRSEFLNQRVDGTASNSNLLDNDSHYCIIFKRVWDKRSLGPSHDLTCKSGYIFMS